MRAARSFDIPFSFNASYCFSFFTLGLLSGTSIPPFAAWLPGGERLETEATAEHGKAAGLQSRTCP